MLRIPIRHYKTDVADIQSLGIPKALAVPEAIELTEEHQAVEERLEPSTIPYAQSRSVTTRYDACTALFKEGQLRPSLATGLDAVLTSEYASDGPGAALDRCTADEF